MIPLGRQSSYDCKSLFFFYYFFFYLFSLSQGISVYAIYHSSYYYLSCYFWTELIEMHWSIQCLQERLRWECFLKSPSRCGSREFLYLYADEHHWCLMLPRIFTIPSASQRVSLYFPSPGSLSQVPHVRSSKLNSNQDTLRHDDKVAPQILLLRAVSFEGCSYVCS